MSVALRPLDNESTERTAERILDVNLSSIIWPDRKKIDKLLAKNFLRYIETERDGNCLYSAIADQLTGQ